MTNFIDGLSFSLHTKVDLDNRKLAEDVIHLMINNPKFLKPKKFGHLHPIDQKVDPKNLEPMIDLWMGKQFKKSEAETYSEGLLLLEFCREGDFMINWTKGEKPPISMPKFNSISGGIPIKYVSKPEARFVEYLDCIKKLIEITKPVFGIIQNMMTPQWDVTYDLSIRLPDVQWGSIFGEPYIEFFGRDKLLNAPFFKVEELPSGHIFGQLTESIFDSDIPMVKREEVRAYLGVDCFMEGKKSYRHYKDGNAPSFM